MSELIVPNIPDQTRGAWAIDRTVVDEEAAKWSDLRAAVSGNPHARVRPGTYVRLRRGSTIVMSDTQMEKRSHYGMLNSARGRVLINGLGLGMIAHSCALKPEVESVEVVERDADVIAMVAPYLDAKVTIHHADAFAWQPPKGVRWNAVWHDIWDDICSDNLPEMHRLHRKYGRRCDWQGSWMRDWIEYQERRYA